MRLILIIRVAVERIISAFANAPQSVAVRFYKGLYSSFCRRGNERTFYVWQKQLRHKVFERRTRPRSQHVTERIDLNAGQRSPERTVSRKTTRDIRRKPRFAGKDIVMTFVSLPTYVISDIQPVFRLIGKRGKIRFVYKFFAPYRYIMKTFG